jgi:hypothetical protein
MSTTTPIYVAIVDDDEALCRSLGRACPASNSVSGLRPMAGALPSIFITAHDDLAARAQTKAAGQGAIMSKRIPLLIGVSALCVAGVAFGQAGILDMAANKVIGKYQSSSCEQLWAEKSHPKSAEEQKAVAFLRNDAQARTAFLNKVAGPIANKLFECGMIP